MVPPNVSAFPTYLYNDTAVFYTISVYKSMDTLIYEKTFSRENLAVMENEYGIKIKKIQQLFTGADKDSFVYKATTDLDALFFVKARTGYFNGSLFELPYLLAESIGGHIIEPVKTLEGNLYLNAGDYIIILYPYINGKSAIAKPLKKDQWIEFGSALRKMHTLKLRPGSLQIPRESYDGRWRRALKKHMESLNNKNRSNVYIKQFLDLYDRKAELIKFIIDNAEDISGRLKNSGNGFCLCHGDIHAGNLFIADDGELYIVDWDTLLMAPKERDLMFIGGGVANTWNTKAEEALFYEGYGEREKVNQEIISYYRFERIIVDLVEYYEQFFAEDFTDGSQVKNQKAIIEKIKSMFYPNGVVDMAFNSGR